MLLYSSAMEFVDQFIKSELPFVSFIDVLALRHSVEMIFRNSGKPSSLFEYIKIISCLALGATMTEQTVWAERLFTQCQELCAEFMDVVNLDMVQVTFIMAQFQMQTGHPNSAYLLTGRAIRKATAAGFHREMPLGSNIPPTFIEQRRLTFWSLCIFEYIICFSLGRPHSISEGNIHILLPDNRFIIIMAQLTSITCRAGQLLYGSQQGSMKSRWAASQEIQQALRQFESSLPKCFQFEDPDTSLPGCQSVAQFFLGSAPTRRPVVYHHTMLLQFRPFLISHTFRQNGHDLAASVTRSSDNDNQDAGSWLQEAFANASETARKLIRFVSTAYVSLPTTKSLRFNGFYIDAACFVLILSMLRSVNPEAEDLLLVHHGLDCLSQMLPDKWAALSHSVFAIKRMLALLDQKRKPEIRVSPGLEPNLSNDLEGGDGAVSWLETQAEFDRLRESTYEALRWDVTNSLF
ncbi:hypothetical protein AFLA70_519g000581 [Aspergillus flavus AF70]|nr:hypothetical protein AFLA70_519g000581 [Aspergillus flavus AF70]